MNTVAGSSNKDKKTCPLNFPSGRWTSESLTDELLQCTEGWLKSLRLASRVSPSPLLGEEKRIPITEICGHQRLNAFASYDPDLPYLRMSQESLLLDTAQPYSETWPKQGMMQNGVCWEQTIVEPTIGGKGSGFWPTPTVQDGENNGGPSQFGRNSLPLNAAVKMWPTPNGFDAKATEKWQPGSEWDRNKKEHTLSKAVVRWPTPSASTSGGHPGLAGGSGNRQKLYKMLGKEEGKKLGCQSLNPPWVEWLMNWPLGWTSLDPLPREVFDGWLQGKHSGAQEGEEAVSSGEMREMWPTPTVCGNYNRKGASAKSGDGLATAVTKAPHRREPTEQSVGEYPDTMPDLSWEDTQPMGKPQEGTEMPLVREYVPIMREQASMESQTIWWTREPNIPRVATGVKERVNRYKRARETTCSWLKAIGNGQVPICMATAFRLLLDDQTPP